MENTWYESSCGNTLWCVVTLLCSAVHKLVPKHIISLSRAVIVDTKNDFFLMFDCGFINLFLSVLETADWDVDVKPHGFITGA